MERTIKVTGKGKISVKPDTIRLKLNIDGVRVDYKDTLKMSAKHIEELKDLFEKLGFERKELKTLFFNVNTQYEQYTTKDGKWEKRFKGYKFMHWMKIEFPLDNKLLGKVLYALAHYPLSPEINILYTVADPEKCKNELLEKAIKDSKEKAEVMARAGGVNLDEILTIDYSWGEVDIVTSPLNNMMMNSYTREMCAESAGYDLNIEPDDIDVSDTVTVVWKIS